MAFNSTLSRATIPALIVGVAAVLMVLYTWRLPPFTSTVEVTDDAYVRGQVTVISPQVAGYVVDIPVHDYATVKQGDLLARIDDRIYQARVAQARAQLASSEAALRNLDVQRGTKEAQVQVARAQVENAEAVLAKARADLRRIGPLIEQNIQSRASGDQLNAALRQGEAGLDQAHANEAVAQQSLAETLASRDNLQASVQAAEAAVHLAEIDLQNTRVTAPRDGMLGEVGARVGQYVSAGTQLTSLVPSLRWVVANYKETQLPGMRVGQPVTFRVDALQGATLTGRVERFSPATGSEFSVIRADNATGNFTKVAQRLPVRIAIDPGQPLADQLSPGMSVVVSIDTAAAPAEARRVAAE
ncbi:HlyD family secretion protein [Roseomonas indoligenes]|uniref:HlyD family secretion protein n=1 Tax=Roseomonas indoligenes TaxID=2820811 RepID=A0A940S7B3_9PROT|nr:HlyD family secretion protein [Pararoseomonas indoligenes]MBP0494770.1 HlyD family secretion protein [Pararoseomonas indoligenes]